jgi:hypothetical protein
LGIVQDRWSAAMRRLAALLAGFALLAACSQNEHGKRVITEQCIADGRPIEVCECLGRTTAERLEPELFDMVVLGAKGEDSETAARMEELSPERRAKFSVTIPEIMRTCGFTEEFEPAAAAAS